MRWKFGAHLIPKQYLMMFGISQFDDFGQDTIAIDRRSDVMVLAILGDTGGAQGIANLQVKFDVETVTKASAE
jgi:lipopolysaccharide transport system ATP-binding protein